jgi:transcriptional regulator with XRE-family HTH domain
MPVLFGQKLRHLRELHGHTQQELALALHLARPGYISNLETNKKAPSLEVVLRVAVYFGVTVDYLLVDSISVDTPITSTLASIETDEPLARFAQNLRDLRIAKGLTQGELSMQLGIARQWHISHLETGRRGPSLDLVIHIADFFDASLDDLLRQKP